MEAPDVIHTIAAEALNPQYYFQSLIEEAVFCGLLSDMDLSKIQTDLFMILAEQTDKWSKGESSSIPTEKAQEIMTSVMFVIGMKLKTYQTPEQAIDILKAEPLKALFENGLEVVRQKMIICRQLQQNILDYLFNTPNSYYRSTILDGINAFFKMYRPEFSAHEIHITADYPIYTGRPELNGIEFIEQYLRCIEAENEFCICFSPQDVHHLLCGVTKDYCSVPINIFEPVVLSAFGLIMINRNPASLDLTKDDIGILYQQLSCKSENEIQDFLRKTLFLLDRKIKLPQNSRQYI